MRSETSRRALVVVDLQRRVVAHATAPHSSSDVVTRTAALADAFEEHGLPVVLVRTVNLDRPDPDGDDLVPELTRLQNAIVVTKHQWAAFHGTPLDVHLRRDEVETVVIAGLMTNFGVEGTARAADELGYRTVVVEDASASFDPSLHAFSIREILPRLGATISTTAELLASLGRAGTSVRI
jgi:nicotinamidase-related amidase